MKSLGLSEEEIIDIVKELTAQGQEVQAVQQKGREPLPE